MKRLVYIVSLSFMAITAHGADENAAAENNDVEVEVARPDEPPRIFAHVTVSASPIVEGTRVDGLAGSVSTVAEKQIEDLNAQDIASALRRVPGVVISRYNPIGSYGGADGGALLVRGQGAGRPGAELTTMVDGIPKFVGVWTHPLLDLLSIDLARQVDVYRGAQPVLFGNMAFASIDLIPKRREGTGFGGRFSAAYGSFDTSVLAIQQDGRSGRFDYFLSASQRQSDGQRPDAGGRTRALFGRLGLALGGNWNLSLFMDATGGRANDPGVEGAPRPATTPRFQTDDVLGVITLSRRHGERTGFLKLYQDDGSIDWLQWDAAKQQSYSTLTNWQNYGFRARDQFRPAFGGIVTAGFDMDRYGGKSREERPAATEPLGDFLFGNDALYTAYERAFGRKTRFTPSVGVRFNHSRYFGDQWGSQAALVVEGAWGRAHTRYAHAYNLPGVWTASFYQGYGRGDQWQDLRPELLDHIEVGFARSFGALTRVELIVFRDAASDALRFVAPPPPPASFTNVGSYRASGVEVMISSEPARAFNLFLGASYSVTTPEDIPYTPHWTATGGLTWTRSRWRIAVDAQAGDHRHVGNLRYPTALQAVDGYSLLNARVAYRLRQHGRTAELFAAGENLTDARYAFRPGYPMPGVSVMGGVNWGF